LFHTADLVGYADMTIDGHRETWPIRSKGFRSWLLYEYYLATGSAPAGEALRLAIETLDAKARYEGPTLNIYLRVGGEGDKIYLDLCDKEWRAVEIDRKGWRVVSRPPIRFRRAPGMLSLPTPVKGGNIDELRPFVNVKGGDFVLLVSFIVAALRDRGPYPGLGLKGEEGSAKSTLAKLTRDLIDPHKVRARCYRVRIATCMSPLMPRRLLHSTTSRRYPTGCPTRCAAWQQEEGLRRAPCIPTWTKSCSRRCGLSF
jgi:hypothetical protein